MSLRFAVPAVYFCISWIFSSFFLTHTFSILSGWKPKSILLRIPSTVYMSSAVVGDHNNNIDRDEQLEKGNNNTSLANFVPLQENTSDILMGIDIQRNQDGVAVIPVKHGEYTVWAMVNDLDYPHLSKYQWFLNRWGYVRNLKMNLIHKMVLTNDDPNSVFEHINGNKLDNRRENLRITSRSKITHIRPKADKFSNHRGVRWIKIHQKWQASITIYGKTKYLGLFYQEGDAAEVCRRAFQFNNDLYARRRQVCNLCYLGAHILCFLLSDSHA